jgi:hypothetical protein
MAIKSQLPLPEFNDDNEGVNGKQINAQQTLSALGITMIHDDLLQGTPHLL